MATPTVVGNSTKIFNEGLARTLGVSVIDALRELGVSKSIVFFLVLFWFASYLTSPKRVRSNAPVQGYRSVFEPTFLLQTRFILGGKEIIHNAYKKMKDQPFVLRRYDVDFMVLPIKYLDEIRVIPNRKLSSRGAQVGNLVPEWNGLEFLIHSDLHIDVLKKKMNPDLYRYVDEAYEELVYGWTLDVPHTDDWTEVNMEYLMRQLVARMTAKVFMGNPVCRDPEWLKISVDFSIDLFKTSFTMKMFPPWTYGLLIWFLPQRYRAQRQLAATEKLVRQLMKGYQEFKTRKEKGEAITREEEEAHDTLFNWMMDHGSPSELEPREMAARQCVLTLASIHTTASTVASMLYELCDHPEWFPVMRDEVDNIVRDFGRPGANLEIGAKQWCARMDKLDSFFVESQRHNPVILLNPQRLANDPITLKDGVHIPAGTRLAFANYEHQMDPETIENPHAFDPMRSYRKRFQSSDPSQKTLHIAGLTNPNNLGFGYGNQACPGRYFAVAEIKLIMARLLYEFEFKLPEGKGKPVSKYVNENVFTDQSATIMMRKRKETWV